MATGTVKWFNAAKGFGFIQPEDGGGDVFVHVSAIERAGLRGLNEGERVNYELTQDRRTGKSSADNLQSLGGGTPGGGGGGGGPGGGGGFRSAEPRPPRRDFAPSAPRGGGGGGDPVAGVVKFFNATKGFGFIQPDEGGGDVFVHISAVERAGLRGLNEGQRVSFVVETDRKSGKLAAEDLQVL